METAQFFVFRRASLWLVAFASEEFGPFASEDEALRRAIDSAEVCVSEGLAARVTGEGRLGGFRTLWSKQPAHERDLAA